MKYTPVLAMPILLLALCGHEPAHAQDGFARHLYLVATPFTAAKVEPDAGGIALCFDMWTPDNGWKLSLDKKSRLAESGQVDLYMTLTPPAQRDGNQQKLEVRTPAFKRRPGEAPLNVWWRAPGGEYQLRALYRFAARHYGQSGDKALANSGYLFPQSVKGGRGREGVRLLAGKGDTPGFSLQFTVGTPYSTGFKVALDKLQKPGRDGVINAWITAEDTFSGTARKALPGWHVLDGKLGKLAPGRYLLLVHRRDSRHGDYKLSQRALLATDAPLTPGPALNAEQRTQRNWQPPAADAPEATGAELLAKAVESVTLQRPGETDGHWTLSVHAMPGQTLAYGSLRVNAEQGFIQLDLRTDKKGTQAVTATLPHLVPGRYQCEIWLDGARLVWCRMLSASHSASGIPAGTDVRGATPDPACQLGFDGWLAGGEPVFELKQSGSGFILQGRFTLKAYEKRVKVDDVEDADADGVIRVHLEFTPEKNFRDKQEHEETLKVRLGKLHAGSYRVEFVGDGRHIPGRTCWINATAG